MAAGKKNAARLGAHLVFIDESGFQLIPSVRRTWAPRGETPILHVLAENHAAIRVYEALGFTTRVAFETLLVKAPR